MILTNLVEGYCLTLTISKATLKELLELNPDLTIVFNVFSSCLPIAPNKLFKFLDYTLKDEIFEITFEKLTFPEVIRGNILCNETNVKPDIYVLAKLYKNDLDTFISEILTEMDKDE